jgi:hypothetical protein
VADYISLNKPRSIPNRDAKGCQNNYYGSTPQGSIRQVAVSAVFQGKSV